MEVGLLSRIDQFSSQQWNNFVLLGTKSNLRQLMFNCELWNDYKREFNYSPSTLTLCDIRQFTLPLCIQTFMFVRDNNTKCRRLLWITHDIKYMWNALAHSKHPINSIRTLWIYGSFGMKRKTFNKPSLIPFIFIGKYFLPLISLWQIIY